ncbi:AlbA family DNA-binding domain-containing protein [Thermosipho affectus]|uniref:AlbA family DNA-binding domain-containing protein n=1 Tax=Thermosipho affectus TaxID=660294 RepID=UPI0009FDA412
MILNEIKKGENKNLEFKEKLSSRNKKSFLKTVVAFANGLGGNVIFVIKDGTKEIGGVPDKELVHLMDRINNMVRDR